MDKHASIRVAELPESARIRISGPLRGAMCRVTYGRRLVSDVSTLRLEMGPGVHNKATLGYIPKVARLQGRYQVIEEREVEVEGLDVEAVAVGEETAAGVSGEPLQWPDGEEPASVPPLPPAEGPAVKGSGEPHDFTGDLEYPVGPPLTDSDQ